MATRTFQVRAGLRRNYGKHEIYYELSENIQANSTGDVREAFISLQSLLEEQVKVYEQVSLPHVQLPASNGASVGNQHESENFTLETIKVEFVDGKRRVKACGGKFVKHGVPVYEECRTDLPIETLSMGVHSFRSLNLTVVCEMNGDKPKKALAIS